YVERVVGRDPEVLRLVGRDADYRRFLDAFGAAVRDVGHRPRSGTAERQAAVGPAVGGSAGVACIGRPGVIARVGPTGVRGTGVGEDVGISTVVRRRRRRWGRALGVLLRAGNAQRRRHRPTCKLAHAYPLARPHRGPETFARGGPRAGLGLRASALWQKDEVT